jgi:hypothetical protein
MPLSRARALLGALRTRWSESREGANLSRMIRGSQSSDASCGSHLYRQARSLIPGVRTAAGQLYSVGTAGITHFLGGTNSLPPTSAAPSAAPQKGWSSTVPDTITTEHQWEAITIEQVQVLTDADGDPVIFSDPDAPARTMYGCGRCDEPMDTHFGTNCEPANADFPPLS